MDTPITTMNFVIVWQGIRIQIAYQPNWLAGINDFTMAYFDITAINPPKAALPITTTVYRSHFLHPDYVAAQGGPEAFVKAWLDAAAHSTSWQTNSAASRQLDLFERGGGQ